MNTKLIIYLRKGIKYSSHYGFSALLCASYNAIRVLVGLLHSRSPMELLFTPHSAVGQVLQSPRL